MAHNQRRDLESETEEFEWIRRQKDEGCDHDSRTLTGGRSQLPVSPSCRAGAYIPNDGYRVACALTLSDCRRGGVATS